MGNLPINGAQLDALKEIGSIGAGNAATAFSQLVSRKVGMTVPSARGESISEIESAFAGKEAKIGVYRKISGDMAGGIALVFPRSEALQLVSLILSKDLERSLSPESEDLLKELGNIVSGSYLAALSKITRLEFRPGVPHLSDGDFKAILNHVTEKSIPPEFAFVIANELRVESATIKFQLVFFPEPGSLKTILEAIGMPG